MRSCMKVAMAVCQVTNVFATSNFVGARFLRADDVLERPYSDLFRNAAEVEAPIAQAPVLVRRGIVVNAAGDKDREDTAVLLNDNGTLNWTAWNAATNEACTKALAVLPRSSNPSGNCICYNLPSLDTKTGVFEADLRLFRISDPRDDFANVSPEQVKVGLQYHGASVSPISEKELMGIGRVSNQMRVIAPRDTSSSGGPRLVQTYMFVGQIAKSKMSENMSLAAFEEVLIPTFTLTATKSTGGTASTNVSLNEASFLTGIFSKSVVLSDFAAAQVAVTAQLDALHNGTIAFVLPGVQIMVFPIGTIITSIWLVLGLLAYGIGTFERINYAEMYKRRQAAGGRSKV
ncbi:hypothetical protein QQS21_009620 [Conoideocrella luteorostrata]|uniref:Uncharacterized protein n=1 Tax=Conoideocrella luteorostrata TaxID=1105319 RepID=A0AAJ0CGW8_9HYPO|nr:hypothetical protein QQS21_009620 [Conoideocrella luteorostrata]